jgi:hypothetical protein
MAEQPPTETFSTKDAPWKRTADYQNIYVNNASVAASSYDIQLRLAQLSIVENKPTIEEVATVFMAPGQAKATALLLLRTVLDYEKTHKISFPLPEHLGNLLAGVAEGANGAKK